jgi:hypothetical protein
MFPTPLNATTSADILGLIQEQMPEDASIEFKATLPSKDIDPWIRGRDEVGERAKQVILSEVIAFANGFGGTVIVGVDETQDKPARAAALQSLPRCTELAQRFRMFCRDLIEPRIPTIEVEGIETDDSGSGVLIIRTPPSISAPHRHTQTLHCYLRHGDRSEQMTMREIQDLTLRRERGLERITNAFSELDAVQRLPGAAGLKLHPHAFKIRASAMPAAEINLGRIFTNKMLRPSLRRNFKATFGSETKVAEIDCPSPTATWRPMIEGVWLEGGNSNFQLRAEMRRSGLTSYLCTIGVNEGDNLHPDQVIGLAANLLLSTDRIRSEALGLASEFAIDIAVRTPIDLGLVGYGGRSDRRFGIVPSGHHRFNRYISSSPEDWQQLLNEIETDLWASAAEAPLGDPLKMIF